MPQVTIYIRQDDYEIWKSIPKKSEVIAAVIHKYREKQKGKTDVKVVPVPEWE